MSGEQPGEYICLSWDGVPDALFVRGHLPVCDAVMAIEGYHDGDYIYRAPVRAWARWSCQPREDGPGHVLRDYAAPGRGRFKVMRAEVEAKQVDPHSWDMRRTSTRYDWEARKTVPLLKPGEECDCTVWRATECPCEAECACHWYPRLPQAAWWRRAT